MESGAVVTPPYVGRPLRLAPMRGVRLAPRRVGDPTSGRLFSRPYRALGSRLEQWAERGQLVHDVRPAVYLHEYSSGGITVRGLVGALDLSHRADGPDDRAVLPHEGIHPVQADALADRMEALRLNPAPILLVHRAPHGLRAIVDQVVRTAPRAEFTDRAEQRHRLWALEDPDTWARVDDELAGSTALIADGHHRYAAYLRLQRRYPGGPFDRGLAMLVDQGSTPLFLGPIHRILRGLGLDDLAVAAESIGASLESTERRTAIQALGAATLAVTDGRRWAMVKLHVPSRRAAVEVVHEDLVPALPRGPHRVEYQHSVEATLAQLRKGGGVAVLMPAPDVDLVSSIAAQDRLLPEKATSFQPKPSAGVLIRSLRDEETDADPSGPATEPEARD